MVCGTIDPGSIPGGRTWEGRMSSNMKYWRVGRVVYGAGFENQCPQGLTGSNPVPSAVGKLYNWP